MDIHRADAHRDAVDFRFPPRDGEYDGGIQQRAEIKGIIRELPEVIGIHAHEFSGRLLQTGVELVAHAGADRLRRLRPEDVQGQPAGSGRAGQDQVLVIGGLERARVSAAQNRAGGLHEVRKPQARLGGRGRRKTVVAVDAQPRRQGQPSQSDGVLDVERELIDVGVPGETERRSAARQVVRKQPGLEAGIPHQPQGAAGGRVRCARGVLGGAGGVHAHGVKARVGDAQVEALPQAALHGLRADLDIVPACDVAEVRLQAVIGERAALGDGGRRVGEGVAAGVIGYPVAPHPGVDGGQRAGAERVLVARRHVEGQHALPLVLRQLVVGIGNLEPVAGQQQVDVQGVARSPVAHRNGRRWSGCCQRRGGAGTPGCPENGRCANCLPPESCPAARSPGRRWRSRPPCQRTRTAPKSCRTAAAPGRSGVTASITRLVLSPNSAAGAPVISSMDWMAFSGSCVENCLLC